MGDEELHALEDVAQAIHDIAEAIPVEALPVDPLPAAQAITWFSRLLLFFARHAYLLVFLGALLENTVLLGFLLPGGAVVALAAASGRTVELSLPGLVLLAAAGMTGGAIVDYFLGRAGLSRLLHHPRAGRWGNQLAHQFEQAEPLLRRHGWWVMLVAHAFGHGRSSLAVAAGASGLPLRRFLAIEAPAALTWSALYAGGGYILAAEWHTFEIVLRRLGWFGAGLFVASTLVAWYWRRRHQAPHPPRGPAGTAAALPQPAGTTPAPAALSVPIVGPTTTSTVASNGAAPAAPSALALAPAPAATD
jgi:membrane-associated protein